MFKRLLPNGSSNEFLKIGFSKDRHHFSCQERLLFERLLTKRSSDGLPRRFTLKVGFKDSLQKLGPNIHFKGRSKDCPSDSSGLKGKENDRRTPA